MFSSLSRIIRPLLVPGILIVLSALLVWKWPDLTHNLTGTKELKALLDIMPLLPYALFPVGIIMGWRYRNTGVFLVALTMALSYFALAAFTPVTPPKGAVAPSVPEAVAFLLPLNLAFFPLLARKWIGTRLGVFCVSLVAVQIVTVALFCHPADERLLTAIRPMAPGAETKLAGVSQALGSFLRHSSLFGLRHPSTPVLFAYAGALLVLLVRFLYRRDALRAGFIGVLAAAALGMGAENTAPSCVIYFSAAGIMVIIAMVETSFSMAYTDELTGLPGRRSFNEALLNLGSHYAIAMIDVDHFKKFNDTYGHKTGDHVLKMIASRLGDLTGGARSFRYGGEEFTAIFPGKSVEEAIPHLEAFRRGLESTPFIIRGRERWKQNPKTRDTRRPSDTKGVAVTVSIGAAAPDKDLTRPEEVLKAADNKLYQAKLAGRNRVEY